MQNPRADIDDVISPQRNFSEADEIDPGFAGPNQVWAWMNATAQATGDNVRAWVAAFTGSTENTSMSGSSTSSITVT